MLGILTTRSFRIRGAWLATEDHALTILLCVNRHDSLQRDKDLHWHTAKACAEFQSAVTNHQTTHSSRTYIEHDLPIGHMLSRNLNALHSRIHNNVGRAVIVEDPLVECPNEVGTA